MKFPIIKGWRELSLAGQFAAAGSFVLLGGMLAIGAWVTHQIEGGVTRNTASATALYMESVLAPLAQELATSDTLSIGARRAADEILQNTVIGSRLASFKIWKEGGLVAYSSEPSIIGHFFEPTDRLRAAWAGQVLGNFDDLHDSENMNEQQMGLPLLEIYSPIREAWSGRVIAVAEFYEIASELEEELFQARLISWLVVAAVSLSMFGLLFGIVLRGSRTIEAQRAAQSRRVKELALLAEQNDALRLRAQRASNRVVEYNERHLRRISAELHDGPAQLLALASLRLDGIIPAVTSDKALLDLKIVNSSLDDAMRDIRDISRGLSLPAIERMTLSEILHTVVEAHQKRTGSEVLLISGQEEPELSQSLKICLYRFVQEGLSNAFRHAGGKGQKVEASVTNGALHLSVSDSGPGFAPSEITTPTDKGGLGLAGLTERVESLGASFSIQSAPGSGTRLEMTADTNAGDENA